MTGRICLWNVSITELGEAENKYLLHSSLNSWMDDKVSFGDFDVLLKVK